MLSCAEGNHGALAFRGVRCGYRLVERVPCERKFGWSH